MKWDTQAHNDNAPHHPLAPPSRPLRPDDPAIRELAAFLDDACRNADQVNRRAKRTLKQLRT